MEATSRSKTQPPRQINNNASKGRAQPARGSRKEIRPEANQNIAKQNKASQGGSKKGHESAEAKSSTSTETKTISASFSPKQQSNPGKRATDSPSSQQQHQQPSPDANKSVLRVNLIKKSSRHLNILALGRSSAIKSESSPQKHNETQPKSATTIASDTSVAVKSPNEVSNEEAKESQKLVVSLIKRISETVSSKEELDRILSEINEAIKEIQLGSKTVVVEDTSRKQAKVSTLSSTENSNNQISNKANSVKRNSQKLDTKNNSPTITNKNITTKDPNDNRSDDIDDEPTTAFKDSFYIDLPSDDEVSKRPHVGRGLTKAGCGRLPDRCLRLTSSHAKFISPHRKRSLEERLSRAQEVREKFLEYRANKFGDILKKVEEMRAWKEEDSINLKASVQTKLQRAEAKRKEQLDKIIRKAHDEESKVSEIQFINNLMAQNRRYDMNSRKKEFESRLQDLQEERQKRFEEKQAKEVAAEERRKALEAERKAKLLEIQRQRKLKTQKVEQQQRVKEKRRIETNRTREQKISAIKEAYIENVQTLKKRINRKQEQSELRHEVNLRLIRQKAFELSIKRYNDYALKTGSQMMSHSQQDSGGLADSGVALVAETKSPRLQLKPFNTKKFCNLCKETIGSESALFSHLRSDTHYSAINEHYTNTTLTTNEAVEIHNLRHIIDTDEPLDKHQFSRDNPSQPQPQQNQLPGSVAGTGSQQSSRASSLVNYYHSSNFAQASGIFMSESDRESLIAIEKKCRKLRAKLIVAGKPFNRDWFVNRIRHRLGQLMLKQRALRQQVTSNMSDVITSVANSIDLSANNPTCQHNKAHYLKMTRITRELISITSDQRISGGGLLPNGIIHSVDRLLADLNKQLTSRRVPEISMNLLLLLQGDAVDARDAGAREPQFGAAMKMMELYAIDSLFLYDIISCLVSILRKLVPNVSLVSKLPSSALASHSTLIDPVSLHSYYYNKSPVLPPRIYIKMIGMLQSLCERRGDICYMIFHSNNMIHLSDILSYRLGFIIGNQSPTSSISGSSSAATLSSAAAAVVQQQQQQQQHPAPTSKANPRPQPADNGLKLGPQKSLQLLAGAANGTNQQPTSGSLCNGVGSSLSGDDSNEDDDDYCEEEGDETNNGEQVEEEDEEEHQCESLETYRRTEEIVDDMTASLCKLLASLTETILSQPLLLLDQVDRAAFYRRSDDFISYMVSVGIVDTESVIMSHIHQHQRHRRQHQQARTGAPARASARSAGAASATGTGCSSAEKCPAPPEPAAAAAAASSQFTSTTDTKIINFSTSCIQFVSSLVKLVISKLATSGSADEQPASTHLSAIQRDPTQLLATLKITQISDVLTLVYELLVHFFHSLEDRVASKQPEAGKQASLADHSAQLGLALESLRLANYVAYIDVKLFQEMLAEDEMLALQLRHISSFLIGRLLQWLSPAIGDTSATNNSNNITADLLNEIILLLGHFAYLNPANQLGLKSGRRPTIMEQLIGLPFDYFARAPLKLVLMPTLISCAYLNDQICALVSQDLSLSMLTSFIEDQLLASQVACAHTKSASERAMAAQHWPLMAEELANNRLDSLRWQFGRRFGKCEWLKAKKYFEEQAKSSGSGSRNSNR